MKVLVIGNCQARPLTAIMASCSLFQMLSPIILHLSSDAERDVHESAITQADLIVAQRTSDDFNPNHLRSASIREKFRTKVIIWPNVFFLGQTPKLRYLNHKQHGRIFGPLDAYHDLHILNDWYYNRTGDEFKFCNKSDDEIAALSLMELREKEKECDIIISDIIEKNYKTEPLFFTFNHPMYSMLAEVVHRIFQLINLEFQVINDPTTEPLGKIRPPNIFSDMGQISTIFQGVDTARTYPQQTKLFTASELRENFWSHYDKIRDQIIDYNNLTVTPRY